MIKIFTNFFAREDQALSAAQMEYQKRVFLTPCYKTGEVLNPQQRAEADCESCPWYVDCMFGEGPDVEN